MTTRAVRRSLPPLLGLAVLAAALVAAGGDTSSGTPRYVAVGDSLAGSSQAHGPRDQGYVERLWHFERRKAPGVALIKLGRGGETAASMVLSPRGAPSQLDAAETMLRDRPTPLVTIDIGANEVERCARSTGFSGPCVEAGLASLRHNLRHILRGLRAAAPRSTRIVGINYYNSFLGAWVRGGDGRALARRSIPVERRINATLNEIYRRFRVPVADVEDAFATDQLHRYVHLSPYGRIPLAVAQVCRWTWSCRSDGDDHANAAGYAVIARVVERVLAPEARARSR